MTHYLLGTFDCAARLSASFLFFLAIVESGDAGPAAQAIRENGGAPGYYQAAGPPEPTLSRGNGDRLQLPATPGLRPAFAAQRKLTPCRTDHMSLVRMLPGARFPRRGFSLRP